MKENPKRQPKTHSEPRILNLGDSRSPHSVVSVAERGKVEKKDPRWFGVQFGLTCWMLLVGVLGLRYNAWAGLSAIVISLLTQGLMVDAQRAQPATRIQLYLLYSYIGGSGVLLILGSLGVLQEIQVGSPISPWGTWVVLTLISVGLSVWFFLKPPGNR